MDPVQRTRIQDPVHRLPPINIDWHQRYGFKPVLLETFVETERHRGTSYKAVNWIFVGKTVGRGKKSRVHQQIIPVKDIWLYPLLQNFRAVLCA